MLGTCVVIHHRCTCSCSNGICTNAKHECAKALEARSDAKVMVFHKKLCCKYLSMLFLGLKYIVVAISYYLGEDPDGN